LSTSFPHIFMFGRVYQRAVGSLSAAQLNHLLRQFNLVPAQDRRLLGYLCDASLRFSSINGVNLHVNSNDRAVQVITKLVNGNREKEELKNAIENPDSKLAKSILNKYAPHLRFAGRNVQFGAFEGSKVTSEIMESSKRFGPPSGFVTFAFADPANPRSLRATFATVDNRKFPAVFDEGSVHGSSGADFMELLAHASARQSSGVIDMHGHGSNARAAAAMNNPVAYVFETKALINDVCSILLGMPPESFFARNDGTSSRKTRYYARGNKGVVGHGLGFNCIMEDHAKVSWFA
jgi:hypothetical protein